MASILQSNIEMIYDEYADLLYRIALSHSGNTEDAFDTVHDVFLKYATLNKFFSDTEHLKAWLIRATINRCHDLKRKRQIRAYIPLEEAYDVPDEVNNLSNGVKNILDGISDKYKSVLILHYLEGFSVEETAGILKLSVSAVKMRLSRARELVKETHKKEDFYV